MSQSLLRSGEASLDLLIEELAGKLQAGEAVDAEAFIAEHPDHAERLRQLWPTLEALARLGPSLGSDGPVGIQVAEPTPQTLGDFRIIRQIGRGGMGVVYEAEQVSLQRRVALKVLPFAATMDSRRLRRFQIEAQAAAQLHHTNIVPVYSVGCEHGVHFYAMQFIDGRSLANVIASLRAGSRPASGRRQPAGDLPPDATTPYEEVPDRPADAGRSPQTAPLAALSTIRSTTDPAFFRTVAELGIQAAEALDYAHQHGIVHRDVKPANLLVESCAPLVPAGETGGGEGVRLWITDFGLAQVQSDTRITITGDLVGTLRYMSPEQALAKRVVVDHRTDIYSLGATLYELLTLEPAYRGTDRQELMRQIAFDEPRPPRRLRKSIPAELETIVLKAMEKNPVERYATAKDLADDLRRYVLDQPIRAKRPGVVHRLRKWGRRHRAMATVAAVCLLVTLAVSLSSIGWVLGDRASRKREAEAKVRDALEAALPGLEQGNPWDRDLVSALRTAEAQLQGGLLSPDLQRRVEQLQKDVIMLAELERVFLERARVRDDHFDDSDLADEFKQAFQTYGIDVSRLEQEEAAGLVQNSAIRTTLAAALGFWVVALRDGAERNDNHERERIRAVGHQVLVDSDPRLMELLTGLSKGHQEIAELLRGMPIEDLPPAMIDWISVGLVEPGGRFFNRISTPALEFLRRAQARYPARFWTNERLAVALHELQPPRLEEAVGFFRAAVALRPDSPGVHFNLGNALRDLRRLDEAIAAYEKAIELKPDYAGAHHHLGKSLHEKGLLEKAILHYRRAISIKPKDALAHNNLGLALRDQTKLDQAIEAFNEAIRLERKSPLAYSNLGIVLNAMGKPKEAIAKFKEAISLDAKMVEAHTNLGATFGAMGMLDEAIDELREAIKLKPDLAEAHFGLGLALHKKHRPDDAIAVFRKAIELKEELAEAHSHLGMVLLERRMLDDAIKEFRRAIALKPTLEDAQYHLGNALFAKGEMEEAVSRYREAIRIDSNLAEAHCNLGNLLLQQGQFQEAANEIRLGHKLGSSKPGWRYPSAQWLAMAECLAKLEPKLPALLKGGLKLADPDECIALASFCNIAHKRLVATAARLYAEAFAIQPSLADDLNSQHRYNAACAAAMAGCGQGSDADQTDDKQRARLRRQALDWLRADLAAYRQLLDQEPDKARLVVVQRMQHWQQDPDFAGVRGSEGLAKLPEAERAEWSKFWQDVARLGKQAAQGKEVEQAADTAPELVPPPKEADSKRDQ